MQLEWDIFDVFTWSINRHYNYKGLICSITYNLGLQDSIGNCSCVSLEYDKEKKEMK